MKRFGKLMMIAAMWLTAFAATAQIERDTLIVRSEMVIAPEDIMHLPGLGLGLQCGPDSLMLLDSPELASVKWLEPNLARDLVALPSGIYAAEGDSIYRVATEEMPRRFIGRLDNEQFSLYPASDTTLYACTAEEQFSCVYLIDPVDRTCMPEFSVEAPIQKISTHNNRSIVWIDDQVMMLTTDGSLVPVYASNEIADVALTPIGIMVASPSGVNWITGRGKGARIILDPVVRLWWDDDDILYYLTADGTLVAVYGLRARYMELNP